MSRCACLKRTIYVSIHASFRDSTVNEFCSRARQLYASVQRERRPYKCTCLFRLVVASGESVHRNLGKKYFPTRFLFYFSPSSPEVKTRITFRAKFQLFVVRNFYSVQLYRTVREINNANSFLLAEWMRRKNRDNTYPVSPM